MQLLVEDIRQETSSTTRFFRTFLIGLTVYLVILAVISSVILLFSDINRNDGLGHWAAPISALALLTVGLSFIVLQLITRPSWPDLCKNLLLSATFLLWSGVQIMKQGLLSQRLGDLVVVLYVVDLAWNILATLIPPGKSAAQ